MVDKVLKCLPYTLLSLLLSLTAINSWAFDYAQEIDKAQKRFGSVKEYPIVIFNQDEISWEIARADAFGDSKKAQTLRKEILKEYVKDKSGLELSSKEAASLDNYITVMKDSAYAMPVLKGDWGERHFKLCAVFPASANTNQRLEHERLLGLLTDDVYGDLAYEDIDLRLQYEQLALFSLYHEISHCLDPEFMLQNYNGHESPHKVHLSESFAEGLALLILEQMGHKNMGRARGHMRMIYSRMMGQYFARNPQLGLGNPFFVKGGVIYHLDPVLRGAQEFAFNSGHRFSDLGLQELIDVMVNIVKRDALDSRTFHAIGSYLGDENKESVLQKYRDWAFDSPELFYNAYAGLLEYHDYTHYVLRELISRVEARESLSKSFENSLIESSNICKLFENNQRSSFQEKIAEWRSILLEEKLSASSQREMAKELNSLHEDLLEQCL